MPGFRARLPAACGMLPEYWRSMPGPSRDAKSAGYPTNVVLVKVSPMPGFRARAGRMRYAPVHARSIEHVGTLSR
jgi:hypothetical protein